jgi:hypothetical protein
MLNKSFDELDYFFLLASGEFGDLFENLTHLAEFRGSPLESFICVSHEGSISVRVLQIK